MFSRLLVLLDRGTGERANSENFPLSIEKNVEKEERMILHIGFTKVKIPHGF